MHGLFHIESKEVGMVHSTESTGVPSAIDKTNV